MNITFLYIIKENAPGFKGEEGVHGGSEENKEMLDTMQLGVQKIKIIIIIYSHIIFTDINTVSLFY